MTTSPSSQLIAPARESRSPWVGTVEPKPWEYQITAAIPVIDHPELLALVITILRLQTERPYILVIDTGSTPENYSKIVEMRAADVEVHTIHSHGWRHPSEPVATAMDLAMLLCHTPYFFTTHTDCFLVRRDVLAEMMPLAARYKAVGYQITERHDLEWQYALGHTCSMFEMATLDRFGVQWSMRRYYVEIDQTWGEHPNTGGWPDTESLFNRHLCAAGVKPYIYGTERNHQRTLDGTIDHCRSVPSSALYARPYLTQMEEQLEDAIAQARARITKWQSEPLATAHTEETVRTASTTNSNINGKALKPAR